MSNIYPSDMLHIERVVYRTDTASRLFPARVRTVAAFDYYGESQLAGEGGGDFFDFITAPASGLITAVGDVSGQNAAAAALLIPGVRNFLRMHVAASDHEFGNTVRDLNRTVCDASPDGFYATLFYASFDAERRLLRFVNAGHEPALLLRNRARTVYHLESTGTVLGLTTRAVYGVRTVALEPGDVLVAFTDGVVEAGCDKDRVFGEAGILDAIRSVPDARASEMVARVLEACRRFAGAAASARDRTAVVIRFNEVVDRPLLEEEAEELAAAAA